MFGERTVQVEFLEDDLREIRALLPEGVPLDQSVEELLRVTMAQYREDEARWRSLEHRHDGEAESAKLELKRRETDGLLVSMRSRTVRSEMAMHELRERVLALQERHLEQRQRGEVLRQSIAALRRRTAQLEGVLRGAARPDQAIRSSSVRRALAQWWKRGG